MERDPRAFLWDVIQAADAIAGFLKGRNYADYESDLLLRSGVERQFEIIGEALNQFARLAPDAAPQIPTLPQIVAFRNRLIHGYAMIDDASVWRIAQESLPQLRETVAALLEKLGQ